MTPSTTAWLLALAVGGVGLLVGSHLNVLIARVPAGRPVVVARSACQGCSATIRARDNVPLLSWVLLRGRCRDCRARISARYPLVEALTALAFGVAAVQILPWPATVETASWLTAGARLAAVLVLLSISIALAAIDLATLRLPDVIVIPGFVLGSATIALSSLLDGNSGSLLRAFLGSLICLALYGLIHVGSRGRGMGLGDVKLSALCGLYLGWYGWDVLAVGTFLPFLLGAVASVVVIRRGGSRKTALPFGPFMLVGTLLALAFGQQIASTYLSVTGLA